jgi:quercetin dioxygenase-like cupin family protein
MKKNRTLIIVVSVTSVLALCGVHALAQAPVATDVTAADIREFIEELPKDRVSDRPIRVVDVTGGYRVGVFGVFRPDGVVGDANLHRVNTTEIYYMLEGAATLITGGELIEPYETPNSTTSLRGKGIEGGVSRRIVPGDVVVIPGHTPHWWSELEGEISYLIFRSDPDNRLSLR